MLDASAEQSDAEQPFQDQILFADQRFRPLMVPRKGFPTFPTNSGKIRYLACIVVQRLYHCPVPTSIHRLQNLTRTPRLTAVP